MLKERRLAAMLPDTVTTCCLHLAQLCGFAACGLKNILDCAEAMQAETDSLPDDLKPFGEAMTKLIMEVLIENYTACLQLISELGMQEITRAALPPTDQTEPD
jgi:hypothetical protein